MAITKSRTQALKDIAAANAGKYLNDAHQVSGKLHFQQPIVQVGGAGTNLTPAGTTGDFILLDEIPSGTALVSGLITVDGTSAINGALRLSSVPTGLTGADGDQAAFVGQFNRVANAPATLLSPTNGSGFVAPSNKRRFLLLEQGAPVTNGTTYFNIVGIRAE